LNDKISIADAKDVLEKFSNDVGNFDSFASLFTSTESDKIRNMNAESQKELARKSLEKLEKLEFDINYLVQGPFLRHQILNDKISIADATDVLEKFSNDVGNFDSFASLFTSTESNKIRNMNAESQKELARKGLKALAGLTEEMQGAFLRHLSNQILNGEISITDATDVLEKFSNDAGNFESFASLFTSTESNKIRNMNAESQKELARKGLKALAGLTAEIPQLKSQFLDGCGECLKNKREEWEKESLENLPDGSKMDITYPKNINSQLERFIYREEVLSILKDVIKEKKALALLPKIEPKIQKKSKKGFLGYLEKKILAGGFSLGNKIALKSISKSPGKFERGGEMPILNKGAQKDLVKEVPKMMSQKGENVLKMNNEHFKGSNASVKLPPLPEDKSNKSVLSGFNMKPLSVKTSLPPIKSASTHQAKQSSNIISSEQQPLKRI
jgi:hypothetical protein